MIILKILGPLLILALTLIQFYLDHKYSDRRTKNYRRFRSIFLITVIISSIVTSLVIFREDKNSSELLNQIESLKWTIVNLDSINRLERANLENTIFLLREDFKPFLQLATKFYPNLEPDSALRRLQEDIVSVKSKIIYLEQSKLFKPLKEEIKEKLLQALSNFNNKNDSITYLIFFSPGNRLRLAFANQLRDLMILSGIKNIEVKSEIVMREFDYFALKINGYGIEQKIFKEFYDILFNYLLLDRPTLDRGQNSIIDLTLDPRGKPRIEIKIYGDPVYENDGRIKF